MPPTGVKKVCKNNPKYFYTGKESSPLGLGYCALSENVGTKRIGNDDTQWIVGMKNGMRVWVRCPTELSKETPVIKKEEPKATKIVIEDESEEEEEPPKKPPPKKPVPKKPVPKKPVVESESESDEEEEPPKKPVVESESESESESEEEEEKPLPKVVAKKPPPKKKSSSEEEAKPPPKKPEPKVVEKAPVKRAQSDYNIYMAWKISELGKENPGMTHKEKFAMAATEWKNLGDKKEEQMVKARAFKK